MEHSDSDFDSYLWHFLSNIVSIPVFVLYFVFIFADDCQRFDASLVAINTLKIRFFLDIVFLNTITGFLHNSSRQMVCMLVFMLSIYVSVYLFTSPFTGPISISIFVIVTLFMRLF